MAIPAKTSHRKELTPRSIRPTNLARRRRLASGIESDPYVARFERRIVFDISAASSPLDSIDEHIGIRD